MLLAVSLRRTRASERQKPPNLTELFLPLTRARAPQQKRQLRRLDFKQKYPWNAFVMSPHLIWRVTCVFLHSASFLMMVLCYITSWASSSHSTNQSEVQLITGWQHAGRASSRGPWHCRTLYLLEASSCDSIAVREQVPFLPESHLLLWCLLSLSRGFRNRK